MKRPPREKTKRRRALRDDPRHCIRITHTDNFIILLGGGGGFYDHRALSCVCLLYLANTSCQITVFLMLHKEIRTKPFLDVASHSANYIFALFIIIHRYSCFFVFFLIRKNNFSKNIMSKIVIT